VSLVLWGCYYRSHAQRIVGANADFVATDANDARVTLVKHLYLRTIPQTKLPEPMHMVRLSEDFADSRRLSGNQAAQRDGVKLFLHHGVSVDSFLNMRVASTLADTKSM